MGCENKKPFASLGLAGRVVQFSEFLRDRGFGVFSSGVQDALRSLEAIDLSKRGDFLAALRTNLTTNELEWRQFSMLFEVFWTRLNQESERSNGEKSLNEPENRDTLPEGEISPDADLQPGVEIKKIEEKEWLEGVAYSRISRLEKRDIAVFETADIQTARLALKRMIAPFSLQRYRRSKRSNRPGDMDFPRVIRMSLKTDGCPMALFYKQKRKRLKRLVMLADVSGSMERYARFVIPFILGFRGFGSRAEVFVFSTSLTSITFIVRHMRVEKALDRIRSEVPEWSGGTRIGYSLHQFNQGYGRNLVDNRSVVVILSDGWDLGGKQLLRREMETLARKAHCVIWLNPLAGDPDYEPVCRGMQTALPYVDYFLPADSLQSLKRVGRLISRIMIR